MCYAQQVFIAPSSLLLQKYMVEIQKTLLAVLSPEHFPKGVPWDCMGPFMLECLILKITVSIVDFSFIKITQPIFMWA